MESNFWISSVTVAGHPSRPDSSVNFKSGLNIICGPSNSGKSWILECIDYMFGMDHKKFILNEKSGYTEVRMRICTPRGDLRLVRPIGPGQNNIEITSTDPRIKQGTYTRNQTKRKPSLNSVWLRLIGFEHPEELKVIANRDLKTQALTWRTFWHALYADEDRISTKDPVLLPTQNTAEPAFKCALASLITGKNYAAYAKTESAESKRIRNFAIIEYLKPLPEQLDQRIELIDKELGTSDPAEIERRVEELSEELGRVQQRINRATQQGQEVVSKLQKVREELAETYSLRSRYEELASSYRARIDRFDFVDEGHTKTGDLVSPTACPVCTQNLPPEVQTSIPAPDPHERQELVVRLSDLGKTMDQMGLEQTSLQEQERQLAANAKEITSHIRNELKPQLRTLKAAIASHNAIIASQAERQQLLERKNDTEAEILKRKDLTFTAGTFAPLDEYPKEFWDQMSTYLLDILGACAFPKLKEAKFLRATFDAVVNGKTKGEEGQGYRSFVNTAVLLALRQYLSSNAAHNPGMLIIDTPLLGLDDPQLDPDLQEAMETIPAALYDHLACEQDAGQVIIADNTKFMPEIGSLQEKCNLIALTKGEKGRYGFLIGANDDDLTSLEGNHGS